MSPVLLFSLERDSWGYLQHSWQFVSLPSSAQCSSPGGDPKTWQQNYPCELEPTTCWKPQWHHPWLPGTPHKLTHPSVVLPRLPSSLALGTKKWHLPSRAGTLLFARHCQVLTHMTSSHLTVSPGLLSPVYRRGKWDQGHKCGKTEQDQTRLWLTLCF